MLSDRVKLVQVRFMPRHVVDLPAWTPHPDLPHATDSPGETWGTWSGEFSTPDTPYIGMERAAWRAGTAF